MAARLFTLTMAVVAGLAGEAGAQSREVEVFYDRYGREILLDVYTGEVVAIREPNGQMRQRHDPDWQQGRRQRRSEQFGRDPYGRGLPDYRDYRALPDRDDRGDDYIFEGYEDDDRGWDDGLARNEPPRYDTPPPYPDLGGGPGRVERAPLGEAPAAVAPHDADVVILDPAQPDIVIEEQPRAIPDLNDAPQVGRTGATEEIAKIQILLDRAGASPGVIDGRIGDNVNKAISAWRDITGETLRTYDTAYIDAKLAETGGDAFITYEITPVDVAGPFVASIPSDYGEKARMERMGYTSVSEMLAERFHMDEKYLKALNPGVSFDRPGVRITVANVGRPREGVVQRIVADKSRRQLRAYDGSGRVIAIYPATIGSDATPSPTGTHTVERIALDPEYTYNPKINFQQGNNTRVLTIPPGPNGPVGNVWIGLSKPTYGIHGSPEPSQIGKTSSNGCIRLTNWDAQELAKMVTKGVTVEFVE